MARDDELERSWNELLAAYPPAVRALAASARKLIARAVPHATQRVRSGWRLLGFSAPRYFACVAPADDHVRIGFEHGILLEDDAGLLEGTGTQMRWLVARRPSDLRRSGLAALVAQAADLVPPARSPTRAARGKPMNAAWHQRHPMPKDAATRQRIAWHEAHQRACACRPVPAKLRPLMPR